MSEPTGVSEVELQRLDKLIEAATHGQPLAVKEMGEAGALYYWLRHAAASRPVSVDHVARYPYNDRGRADATLDEVSRQLLPRLLATIRVLRMDAGVRAQEDAARRDRTQQVMRLWHETEGVAAAPPEDTDLLEFLLKRLKQADARAVFLHGQLRQAAAALAPDPLAEPNAYRAMLRMIAAASAACDAGLNVADAAALAELQDCRSLAGAGTLLASRLRDYLQQQTDESSELLRRALSEYEEVAGRPSPEGKP